METDTLLTSIQPGNWSVQIQPFTVYIIVSMIVVLVLLFVSALVSGSEVAYFSLNANDKQKLKRKGKTNHLVLKNLENPEKLLATILVTNNFVNIGIIILTANITNNLINVQNSTFLVFIFQVVLITFLLLVFSEILPKLYANHYSLGFARFMALPLQILEKVFRPLNSLLIVSTSFINTRLQKHKKNLSMDEISHALKLTSEQELSEEKEILEGIVKFGNKNVAEIMKPRVDVVSLDIKTSFKTVLNVIVDSGFSRIPVYV
ncbi:MAG TPA: CNNM domain-containing protein, partial [Draconibacterium sp.]|nr:CNNM domain-containing protein [Draconibacterium sp.]